MKQFFLGLLLLLSHQLMGQKQEEILDLNQKWYFTQAGKDNWLAAEVPGTVHQDLIRHQLLPDPFYGMNEEKIQWVEEEDWEYKTSFVVTADQLNRDAAILNFEGLDTYADVYLNGACLLRGDNMFVGHKIPVKQLLREGENHLHIYFHSPIKQTLPQWRSNGFNYPASNDHRKEKLSVFTRKTPCSFGWDWGIRMVTSGIWRPISLCFQDVVTIEDCYVRQVEISSSLANLEVELELENLNGKASPITALVSYDFPGKETQKVEKQLVLNPEKTKVTIPVQIKEPELWMPNGWGKPNLYSFEVTLKNGDQIVAQKKQRVGLRTIKVVNEKGQDGESFYFMVNGIPMFAKGANYIPSDAMLPSVTPERYRSLFEDVKAANMNMLRVWGGGIYENDYFYELADEFGILIWQDFMFACAPYPHDPLFLQRVEAEAKYNIRRLRNHACLALWCGNNEIFEALRFWSWRQRLSPEMYEEKKKGYKILFEDLLAKAVEKWDGERFYMHSSPYFSRWDQPETFNIGDSHHWGVWAGKKPFSIFDQEVPHFMSEFGFQAFPEMKTIATFADSADFQITSPVMNIHQKSSAGNGLIHTYMERDYVVPEKFEDFVYVGLVMQGRGIRQGFEAHRRNRPYCMGTLYWQLNDNWPVVSWSGRDYYGNWKALHYQAQRAFAPLLVDVYQDKDHLQVWLISDELQDRKGLTMEMKLTDFYGKVIKRASYPVEALANSSSKVFDQKVTEWVTPELQRKCYLLVTLKDKNNKQLSEEPYFFNVPKELDLPKASVVSKVKVKDGVCEVTLKSSELAKDVFIEIPVQGARFSDNFFDLLPKSTRKIVITSPSIKEGQPIQLKINHIRNTY